MAWEPPTGPLYGELVGYRLFYDQEGHPEYVEVDVPATQHTYTARFLYKDTAYRFQSRVVCVGGFFLS